jgi:hypothetical protein
MLVGPIFLGPIGHALFSVPQIGFAKRSLMFNVMSDAIISERFPFTIAVHHSLQNRSTWHAMKMDGCGK